MQSVAKQLQEIAKPFDLLKSPNWYFIVGDCMPRDNVLLKFGNLSKQLWKVVSSDVQLKYLLRERDLKIDLAAFNEASSNVFN